MDGIETAREVLAAMGGAGNVIACDMCMTRLRLKLADPGVADLEAIGRIQSVLGVVRRGENGLEVVFGPGVVEDVHDGLMPLVGDVAPSVPPLDRPEGTMRVVISPGRRKSYRAQARALAARAAAAGELGEILSEIDEAEVSLARSPRLLVINGPNLNMLGVREPDIYGRQDYAALVRLCKDAGAEAGFSEVRCYQSNHEGDLVDEIQRALHSADAIVINPGAYTHTSVALLDALKAVRIPAVEVHISQVDEREEFRQVSYVRIACIETIAGLGLEGYRKAIFDLAEHLASARG